MKARDLMRIGNSQANYRVVGEKSPSAVSVAGLAAALLPAVADHFAADTEKSPKRSPLGKYVQILLLL